MMTSQQRGVRWGITVEEAAEVRVLPGPDRAPPAAIPLEASASSTS